MKRKPKEKTIIKKIVFDEKTAEPIIVEVPASSLDDSIPLLEKEIPKADFMENSDAKSIGKQLVMTRFLGISKEDESIGKKQKALKRILTTVFIVFVLGVFAFTFYNDFFSTEKQYPSLKEMWLVLLNSWEYLLYALLALTTFFFLKGLKMSIMCKSMTKKFHFATCFETGIIGTYYNCITPLAVGGQPFEIYHLSKHGIHGGVASSLPIASFFLNQLAFVTLGIVCLIMFKNNTLEIPQHILGVFPAIFTVLAVIGLVCSLFLPLMVVIFSLMPKLGAKLVHFGIGLGGKLKIIKDPKSTTKKTIQNIFHNSTCLKKLGTNPIVFFLTLLISFAERLAEASIAYFALRFFGFDLLSNSFLEWMQVVQIVIVLYAAISFIPTPGNSGAADLSFYLLFEVGLLAGFAFPAMILWRLLSFYSYIVIGFIFTTIKKKADRKRLLLSKE